MRNLKSYLKRQYNLMKIQLNLPINTPILKKGASHSDMQKAMGKAKRQQTDYTFNFYEPVLVWDEEYEDMRCLHEITLDYKKTRGSCYSLMSRHPTTTKCYDAAQSIMKDLVLRAINGEHDEADKKFAAKRQKKSTKSQLTQQLAAKLAP